MILNFLSYKCLLDLLVSLFMGNLLKHIFLIFHFSVIMPNWHYLLNNVALFAK